MTDASDFRGYSVAIDTSSMHIPFSGYSDIGDVASAIVHQLQSYGRALPLDRVTEVTKSLAEWADDPAKPWTCTHEDVTVTVRKTDKFTGWESDTRPL